MLPKSLLSLPHLMLTYTFKGKKIANRFMYLKNRSSRQIKSRQGWIHQHQETWTRTSHPSKTLQWTCCSYRGFKMNNPCPPWRLSQKLQSITDMSANLPTMTQEAEILTDRQDAESCKPCFHVHTCSCKRKWPEVISCLPGSEAMSQLLLEGTV